MKIQPLIPLCSTIGIVLGSSITFAQTVPPSTRIPVADSTLGTQVSGTNNNFTITGGVSRGQNLFQSFQDFSVPTGGAATFINPAGNRAIITRVTGNLFSDIDGTINTQGANFFLINPNGMVFGANTRLNVGQTFVGSTANGIDLVDAGGNAYRFGTNGTSDAPLLTINPNVLLTPARLILGGGNGQISNLGTLQTTNPNQYIGLIGGNVNINGGKIIAPGGRVDLGGLNSAGTVTANEQGLVFGGNNLSWGDVSLTNGAVVSVRANETLGNVNISFSDVSSLGSSINISTNNLNILNSGAKTNTGLAAIDAGLEQNSGVKTAAAGDININATGKITLDNSDIKTTIRPGSEGRIGNIKIKANSLEMKNGSLISSLTRGKGNAGNIDIETQGDMSISGIRDPLLLADNESSITSNTGGKGNAGNITISTKGNLFLNNLGGISSGIEEQGEGNAGNIDIKTAGNFTITGTNNSTDLQGTDNTALSSINSSTYGQGDAGKITIDTQGKLSIINRGGIFSFIGENGVGNSGGIKINAGELEIANNSRITTNTSQSTQVNGKGNAGNIDIKTVGNLTIIGTNNYDLLAGIDNTIFNINSSTFGQGDAGKITIDTKGTLSMTNGGILVSTVGENAIGNSGGIKIDAGKLEIANGSSITTSTYQSTAQNNKGNAGNIDIKTTGDITISGTNNPADIIEKDLPPLSAISSNTFGQGNTGKITIDTQGKLSVVNRSQISSGLARNAVGNSGGIKIDARELEIANISDILTQISQKTSKGQAGNIGIKTTGNLTITGINNPVNLQEVAQTSLSSISSSTYGQGDAGKITIETKGKLSVSNRGVISSIIGETGVGNSQGIKIDTNDLELANSGVIQTVTSQLTPVNGKGNAGNIDIKTTGNLTIFGTNNPSDLQGNNLAPLSAINSGSQGQGNAGNITIDTKGKLFINNRGAIASAVGETAVGNSGGIKIDTGELQIANISGIETATFQSSAVSGKGNAGNIDIKIAGNLTITGTNNFANLQGNDITPFSGISARTFGQGDAGKITIDTKGKLFIANRAGIFTTIDANAVGNSEGIKINAGELELSNRSNIETATLQSSTINGRGNAGNIDIKTTGNLTITGTNNPADLQGIDNTGLSNINSSTYGQGNAGKITIDAKDIFLIANRGGVFSFIDVTAVGNSGGIKINAGELELSNHSNIGTATFQSSAVNGKGNAGNIDIKVQGAIKANLSDISSSSFGQGEAANILINSDRFLLDRGGVFSSSNSLSGGNITLTIDALLLMRNNSGIIATSGSSQTQSKGGNINISVPFIVTAPKENSDIAANAFSGSGGKVTIDSQQNFWISPLSRAELEKLLGTTDPNRLDPVNLPTNNITAISQANPNLSGQVNITPPGIDITAGLSPLPNSVTDPSNRINPNCSPKAIGNNSFTSVGRGGIPASPRDPLNEEQIATNWVTLNPQDKLSSATTTPPPAQLPQPIGSAQAKPIVEAQAWRREQNGDILLVAQSTANRSFPQSPPASGCAVR
jgi:filamentous hemagglutinin family protein